MLTDIDGTVLRAEFSAQKVSDGWEIWLESGGGGRTAKNARNPDHAKALVLILERLKGIGALLADALVDSRNTQRAGLTDAQRRVLDPHLSRPVDLSGVRDVAAFALALRKNGAAVQRSDRRGGNPEKRLQLRVRLPIGHESDDLVTLLATGARRSRGYVLANELVSPEPPTVRDMYDLEALERGLRGHNRTQNALAQFLMEHGIAPFSPEPREPNFDLAWRVGERLFVAEVKSTTVLNEEKQLRLGLGQVLRFAHQLGRGTRAVLVCENQPSDDSWLDLCASLGIILCWPASFQSVLAESDETPRVAVTP